MNTVNRHITFTPEQDRAIVNRAWQIFNAKLNEGLAWAEAKSACIASLLSQREAFDQSFDPHQQNPNDPLLSAMEWEVRMDQYNRCLYHLNDIP